jgi:DNA-binding NarL/FixJ family response regulator
MDCQMPGVDGYQATREIRSREVNSRVPIVAFTAHAFEEEREKVAACGMDDYVAKPIEPVALRRVLRRYLAESLTGLNSVPQPARNSARTADAASSATPIGNPSPKPPLPTAEVAAPGADSKPPVLSMQLRRPPRAVHLFLTTIPRQLELLQEAALEERTEEVRAMAHKLKGSSGSIGAMQMASLCDELQRTRADASRLETLALIERITEAHGNVGALLMQETSFGSVGS